MLSPMLLSKRSRQLLSYSCHAHALDFYAYATTPQLYLSAQAISSLLSAIELKPAYEPAALCQQLPAPLEFLLGLSREHY